MADKLQDAARVNTQLAAENPLPTEQWHAGGDTGSNLRDLVLGISDGLVTVVSFVAGSTALLANSNQVLRTGFAEMFAGAISMGLGAYLGGKSQQELYQKERTKEYREVDEIPEVERDEIRTIYRRKGFEGDELEMVVARITADKDRWVAAMMNEELGYGAVENDDPRRTGVIVGISYVIGALFPLLPYVLVQVFNLDRDPTNHATVINNVLFASIAITMLALFAFGAFKSRFTHKAWWQSGAEMVLTGAVGATAVYSIGWLADRFLFQ